MYDSNILITLLIYQYFCAHRDTVQFTLMWTVSCIDTALELQTHVDNWEKYTLEKNSETQYLIEDDASRKSRRNNITVRDKIRI